MHGAYRPGHIVGLCESFSKFVLQKHLHFLKRWVVGWFGIGWFGISWLGIGWFGFGWFGIGLLGIGWFGVGWFGIGWSGSEGV